MEFLPSRSRVGSFARIYEGADPTDFPPADKNRLVGHKEWVNRPAFQCLFTLSKTGSAIVNSISSYDRIHQGLY